MRSAFGRVVPVTLILVAVLLLAGTKTSALQPDDPIAVARLHLSRNAGVLGLSPGLSDLQAVAVRQGLTGQHVRFQQTLNGVPIFGAFVTVNLPAGGAPRQPTLLSRYRPGATAAPTAVRMGLAAAVARARVILSLTEADSRGQSSVKPVYFDDGGRYVRAWQLLVPVKDPVASWLLVLRADDGQVLLQENILRFDSGRVFDPNPAKSSGGSIPPPSDCDSAGEESLLAGQYQTKALLGLTGGQNKLKGQVVDLTAPGIVGAYKAAGQADDATHTYLYACNDDRFEETMVYHHIDAVQRKIQSFGF